MIRRRASLCCALLVILLFGAPVRAQELVIADNDYRGPAGSDVQSALILIANPSVKVLGLTVVTGDGWRDEEAAYLRRFLEVAGAADVPVFKGAVFPLVNSKARMTAWEAAHGKIPWKGAFSDPADPPGGFHPDDPFAIPDNPAGAAKTRAEGGSAIEYLIRAVHAHPHQVTILAAGPMTDLALAIRQDPEFAPLAKQLVFVGGIVDDAMAQATGVPGFYADFNMLFDPEATHIVLTADWPKIICLGSVTLKTVADQGLLDRIGAVGTPIGKLMAEYDQKQPLWDELAAAFIVDPAIATKTAEAYMDVDIDHGATYGQAYVWTEDTRPHVGEHKVTMVTDVDSTKLKDMLVKAASFNGPAHGPH